MPYFARTSCLVLTFYSVDKERSKNRSAKKWEENVMTTAYVRMTEEQRAAREEARKQRIRDARVRQLRKLLYAFVCWLQEVLTDWPKKLREGATNLFACTICIILISAVFFACLGLLELAITFWGDLYFG